MMREAAEAIGAVFVAALFVITAAASFAFAIVFAVRFAWELAGG